MKAMDVAKYFLNKANQDGDLITNLKMQKLLYYAQAWYLVNFKNKKLFGDEIEAWSFGPVIPTVYHQFKNYRHVPISYENNVEKIFKIVQGEDRKYLDEFYDKFVNFAAHDLVNMSHNEDPWKEAYKSPSRVMDIEKMREYYNNQISKKN